MSHPASSPSSRKHRVLFVSHEATRTGAPMFLLHLLRWLRANTDLQFELLIDRGGPLEPEFAGVTTVHTYAAVVAKPGFLKTFDLIYSNTACNGGMLEELDCGDVPVVTHVHELDTGFQWLGARNMASVLRQTNRYIACAHAVASRLKGIFRIPGERIGVHHEMIDVARVDANKRSADLAALRREHDIPEDALVIAGCGTFDLRKAPDVFVQLGARLKRMMGSERPLRFLWIGSKNSAGLVSTVEVDARKLGIAGETRLIGEVPSPHGLLALSDIFCLTSREDPFPLVMLEAAALGLPMVCFDGAGGGREFCDLGGGIAVSYLDVDAMAATCAPLLKDASRRGAIGLRASELVRNRFTVDAVAPEIWLEIQEQLSNPAPASEFRGAGVRLSDVYASWPMDEAPHPEYIEAHFAREAARKQARVLESQGRKIDAVRMLVQAVSRDIDSRSQAVMFEGLVHIAADISRFDPRQASLLFERAERIERTNPYFKIARFREWPAAPRTAVPNAA